MVGENDLFITNLFCDGLYQNLKLFKSIDLRKSLNKVKNKHIILDDYITFKNLIKSLIESMIYFYKFRKLLRNKFLYKSIDITDLIRKEIKFSYQRILGNLILHRGLVRIMNNIHANKYIYHLHEYVLGRVITFTLHQSKITNTFGFQHGPASYKLLLYNNSPTELAIKNKNFLHSVPIPNSVFVENKQSADVYKRSGFRNISILKKIPRLNYLYGLELNKNRNIYLIISGLHDFKLVYSSTLKVIKNNPENIFIFKPHPKSNLDLKKFPLPNNAKYSRNHIKELLINAKVVYASYSSVLAEALSLNIEVNIIECPGVIDLSSISEI